MFISMYLFRIDLYIVSMHHWNLISLRYWYVIQSFLLYVYPDINVRIGTNSYHNLTWNIRHVNWLIAFNIVVIWNEKKRRDASRPLPRCFYNNFKRRWSKFSCVGVRWWWTWIAQEWCTNPCWRRGIAARVCNQRRSTTGKRAALGSKPFRWGTATTPPSLHGCNNATPNTQSIVINSTQSDRLVKCSSTSI